MREERFGEREGRSRGEKERELKEDMFYRMVGRSRIWEDRFCRKVLRFGRYAGFVEGGL